MPASGFGVKLNFPEFASQLAVWVSLFVVVKLPRLPPKLKQPILMPALPEVCFTVSTWLSKEWRAEPDIVTARPTPEAHRSCIGRTRSRVCAGISLLVWGYLWRMSGISLQSKLESAGLAVNGLEPRLSQSTYQLPAWASKRSMFLKVSSNSTELFDQSTCTFCQLVDSPWPAPTRKRPRNETPASPWASE